MTRKKTTAQAWIDELKAMYPDDGIIGYEEMLGYFPTKESWLAMQEEDRKYEENKDHFQKIRLSFKTDGEFEDFRVKAIKDNSLLKKYMDGSSIPSFSEYLKRRNEYGSGTKKLVYYFTDLLKQGDFQEAVRKIRKKYDMPLDGYPFSEKDADEVAEKGMGVEGLEDEIEKLALKYGLYSFAWHSILLMYIFFNHVDFRNRMHTFFVFSLCKIVDEKTHRLDFSKDTGGYETDEEIREYREQMNYIRERENTEFPVSLRISPYASERDILDFLKRHFSDIARIQKGYRLKTVGIGKVKKKNSFVVERNELIYKNKHLPRKKIMELLTDKYGAQHTVDYAYIGKIISLEKKKRKEV